MTIKILFIIGLITLFLLHINSLVMKFCPKNTKFYNWWEKNICSRIN